MSYISTKMDPNQAQLMLKQVGSAVSESYLAERGEFKTAKLVAVYKTLKPKQQARIKQVLTSITNHPTESLEMQLRDRFRQL